MAAVNFELRSYQLEALHTLGKYLKHVARMDDLGLMSNPAKAAFNDIAGNYYPAPLVNEQTPYLCIRIPTGGGKTIVAAHSIGVAAKNYLQVENPMVLWLVPSTAILDQTLNALRNLDHPYRAALAKDFGRNLSVLTVSEALALSRPDATGGACIIVATLQAFRRDDSDKSTLKVYQDSGALMDHFSGLLPAQITRLEMVEGSTRPVASLCNVLRLHRPMVIVDEAHNARTPLSFDTLQRFDPSLILEFTATPQLQKDIAKELYPSNVLFHVSAAELKAEQMIKLPIRLQTDADWKKVIGQALDCQTALEAIAKTNEAETGEYIRPIILFQAQSKSKTDQDRITPEVLVQFLTDDKRIPRDQIAIHATGHAELDAIDDIQSPTCPVRYVVTVQKLREGWDCPFAYILCSVAELSSPTAVEQILGRVLRMPKAKRKTNDLLNRAYAFVASTNFQDVAEKLKDGLVDGAGFERIEADELVKPMGFEFIEHGAAYVHQSDALPDTPDASPERVQQAINRLPASLKARLEYDATTREIGIMRPMSRDDRNTIQMAFASVRGAETVIDRLFLKSNQIQASELPDGEKAPFIMPRLGIYRQGVLELLAQDHFLHLPWNLAECDPNPFASRFEIQANTKTGEIDVSDKGQMKIAYVGELHDQLALSINEPAWTLARLVNWIDRGIPHPDITKPAARVFIQRALERLMQEKTYSIDTLARYKYELRRGLSEEIDRLRVERENESYGALFASSANNFATSAEVGLLFDEQSYSYNQPYKGGQVFKKHYANVIGDLMPNGQEFRCAVYLDNHKAVRYWLRNVDRKPNTFWLQLPNGRFYPDFVAMLNDGRFMAIEFKGQQLVSASTEKVIIGKLWAESSNGTCLFAMPVGTDLAEIDRVISS
jgi:type III restriction enzyme